MWGGTRVALLLAVAALALGASAAGLAQAPTCCTTGCCTTGGSSSSSSASSSAGGGGGGQQQQQQQQGTGTGGSSSSASAASSSSSGGGGQQQQQQQQSGGSTIIVVQQPVAGTVQTGTLTPVATAPPTQVFIPPRTTQRAIVTTTYRPRPTYRPPPRRGNLPFTGLPTALGIIAGCFLLGSGVLLLTARRRDETLERVLLTQAAALTTADHRF